MIIYGYNEQSELAYANQCISYYTAAHAPLNINSLVWQARMTRDSVLYDYWYSTAKHSYELYVALGSPFIHNPPSKPQYDVDITPVNIRTEKPSEVQFFIKWWLLKLYNNNDANNQLWYDYVMDTAGEGHAKGWTADSYWQDKMIAAYPPC